MTDPDQAGHDIQQQIDGAGDRLACGCDVDDLLEQAADGRASQLTEHQRRCPACQAALGELSRLWEPVRHLAARPVPIPAGLRAAVARQLGKLVPDIWYALQPAEAGALRVAARVVASIATDAASTAPGVEFAFGRSPHRGAASTAIDLAIAVRYNHRADVVAREVRRRASEAVRARAGLDDITVNVTIDDIIT